ncbi:spermidine synthase [Patescibacteria group bacterium]|nr:spermidine synthase [Patescibacteria group bacterium]
MYKYNGLLIYQARDDHGLVEVVEEKGIRSLHFGSLPKQSSMAIAHPNKLELSYVRAMTCWQLFKPELEQESLIIGLGGGSLTKYLWQQFPNCKFNIIECRSAVVKVARSHFGLPIDSRLKIIIDDGGTYIQQRIETHQARYELLAIDAFDHKDIAESVITEDFFIACRALLKSDGVLIMNLWGGEGNASFVQCRNWLTDIFDLRVLFLPVEDRDNVIALAFNQDLPFYNIEQLHQQAKALEQLYSIEFTKFLKDLRKYNARSFHKILKT